MDMKVRIICIILLFVVGEVIFDNLKLLIETNRESKFTESRGINLKKPKVDVKSLLKVSSFFLMINHGPDLCKMNEKIKNIPYYRDRCYLSDIGEHNDKN